MAKEYKKVTNPMTRTEITAKANARRRRDYPEKTKEYMRKYRLLTQYNLTPAQYDEMLKAQDGHCAMCPNEPASRVLAVDHDHQTGKVRALLCHTCNNHLGIYERRHEEFAAYLEKHG